MKRRGDKLVEGIFKQQKQKGTRKQKEVSTLFQPSPAPKKKVASAPRKSIGRKFPLGLDIGKHSVKWVQLGQIKSGLCVAEVGRVPIDFPPELAVATPASLAKALQEMVHQRGGSGDVTLSLGLEDVQLQFLKMPKMSEAEQEEAVRLQVEQLLPTQVSFDEVSMDFMILEGMGEPTESRVLVATVFRKKVMEKVQAVQLVGLRPVAVDIDPFALAAGLAWKRAFVPQETILLLQLGDASAFLSVVVKEQLVFARSMLTTGHRLTQAVVDRLQVPWDEAESLKRTHGVLDAPDAMVQEEEVGEVSQQRQVAQALASPLENLLIDLLHSFKSFSYQAMQSNVQRFDRLTLAGGGAQLPGLAPWLKKRVGVPVEVVNAFDALAMAESVTAPGPGDSMGSEFAIATGLALREVSQQQP